METKEKPRWQLWAEYCNLTGREAKWGLSVGELLTTRGILPCQRLLDVGCGTGEFTKALTHFTSKVVGMDNVDTRSVTEFDFMLCPFEEYEGDDVDVYVFKQAFHLLENSDKILQNYLDSILVILQMPQPSWDDNDRWNKRPLNAQENADYAESVGRKCEIQRLTQSYEIEYEFVSQMFLEGYTSDLQRMTQSQRNKIWNSVKSDYNAGLSFQDTLDVIICHPSK